MNLLPDKCQPLVIVTPVYEDTESCTHLFEELATLFGKNLFVLAVDDGSVHEPLIPDLFQQARVSGAILKLRRNVGHQRAIAIGLSYVAEHLSDYHRVVVMDSDCEDVPATISNLLKPLEIERVDVVVAKRKSRIETLRFRMFYIAYKLFFRIMTGRSISFGNFMALKPHAVRRMVTMQELSLHVAGAVLASKLRVNIVPLDRGPRYAGQSKMNFFGLALHGFKALMVFAEDVLVRVGVASALIATFTVAGALTAVVLKWMGYSTPGWFSIALGILLLLFLQTGMLAMMTLMLTGVVRGGTVTNSIAYLDFIEAVLPISPYVEKE
jgi:hypothetical protein